MLRASTYRFWGIEGVHLSIEECNSRLEIGKWLDGNFFTHTIHYRGQDEDIDVCFCGSASDASFFADDVGRVFAAIQQFRFHTNARDDSAGEYKHVKYVRSSGSRTTCSLADEHRVGRIRLRLCHKGISETVVIVPILKKNRFRFSWHTSAL